MRRATHTFANHSAEVGRARRAVGATLESWGAPVDQNLLLVVSELMTNAVRHGSGVVELTLACDDHRIRLEVHDEGSATLPAFRSPQTGGVDVGGFGLRLVDALADDWGIDHNGGTKVWAERAFGTTAGDQAPTLRPAASGPARPGRHGPAPGQGPAHFARVRLPGPTAWHMMVDG